MRRCRLLAGLLAGLVVACGGEVPSTAAGSTTGSPTTHGATSSSASSFPATSSSSIAWPGAEVEADVDGDGSLDEVAVVVDGGAALGVRFATGDVATSPLETSPFVEPAVAAVARMGGEVGIVVHVDRGAATDLHVLYTWWDGRLVGVTSTTGAPVVLATGASVTHASGVACTPEGVEIATAESADGEVFATTTVAYRLEATELVEVTRRTGSLRIGDPTFATFSALFC